MPLLTSTDYPSVRGLLDVTFVEQSWPSDDVIDLTVFAPEAERLITNWAPEAASSVDPVVVAGVKTAALYLTAALMAPSIPRLLQEDEGGYRYRIKDVDWQGRANELQQLAVNTLAIYRLPNAGIRHTSFTVARTTRSYPRRYPILRTRDFGWE